MEKKACTCSMSCAYAEQGLCYYYMKSCTVFANRYENIFYREKMWEIFVTQSTIKMYIRDSFREKENFI